MRIAALSATTGVPVATLKYYLREGLLHSGAATAVNQAEYDDTHVQRVRLVRALLQMGHLSIADAQRVVAAAEDDSLSTHDMFGVAQDAMVPAAERGGPRSAAARAEVDRFVARHSMRVRPDAEVRRMLADVLVTASDFLQVPPGECISTEGWDAVVPALLDLATHEVGQLPDGFPRATLTGFMVEGTVVFEVGLAAIRRMALEHASAERFAAAPRRQRGSRSKRSP